MEASSLPEDLEKTYDSKRPLIWTEIVYIISPFLFFLPLLFLLLLMLPEGRMLQFFSLLVAYVIPPAGKESIIPCAIILGYDWWMIASAVFIIDCASACFIAMNFHHIAKIPWFGEIFMKCNESMKRISATNPWLSRLSLFGLFLFIFFPRQGSGAINGTILGRVMGISPRPAFLVIIAGSGLSALTIASGIALLNEFIGHTIVAIITILLIIIGTAVIFYLHKARGTNCK